MEEEEEASVGAAAEVVIDGATYRLVPNLAGVFYASEAGAVVRWRDDGPPGKAPKLVEGVTHATCRALAWPAPGAKVFDSSKLLSDAEFPGVFLDPVTHIVYAPDGKPRRTTTKRRDAMMLKMLGPDAAKALPSQSGGGDKDDVAKAKKKGAKLSAAAIAAFSVQEEVGLGSWHGNGEFAGSLYLDPRARVLDVVDEEHPLFVLVRLKEQGVMSSRVQHDHTVYRIVPNRASRSATAPSWPFTPGEAFGGILVSPGQGQPAERHSPGYRHYLPGRFLLVPQAAEDEKYVESEAPGLLERVRDLRRAAEAAEEALAAAADEATDALADRVAGCARADLQAVEADGSQWYAERDPVAALDVASRLRLSFRAAARAFYTHVEDPASGAPNPHTMWRARLEPEEHPPVMSARAEGWLARAGAAHVRRLREGWAAAAARNDALLLGTAAFASAGVVVEPCVPRSRAVENRFFYGDLLEPCRVSGPSGRVVAVSEPAVETEEVRSEWMARRERAGEHHTPTEVSAEPSPRRDVSSSPWHRRRLDLARDAGGFALLEEGQAPPKRPAGGTGWRRAEDADDKAVRLACGWKGSGADPCEDFAREHLAWIFRCLRGRGGEEDVARCTAIVQELKPEYLEACG